MVTHFSTNQARHNVTSLNFIDTPNAIITTPRCHCMYTVYLWSPYVIQSLKKIAGKKCRICAKIALKFKIELQNLLKIGEKLPESCA